MINYTKLKKNKRDIYLVDLPGFDDSDYLHNIENDIST